MIRILWISHRIPLNNTGHAGGQTFSYYFKNFLADDKFQIKLIAFGTDDEKSKFMSEFEGVSNTIFTYNDMSRLSIKVDDIRHRVLLLNKYASLIPNCLAKSILEQLKLYKQSGYYPDIVILEWTQILVMLKDIIKIYPSCKYVASEHDVTFIGYKRKSLFNRGIKKMTWAVRYFIEKALELECLSKCDLILPHNFDNKNILLKNGINSQKIHELVPFYYDMCACQRKSNQRDILFFGAMSRQENILSAVWFIKNVMPLLSDLDVRFVIMGNRPSEELRKMESERVHITGFVDYVEPFFQESMCFVAPLVLGAGIKVKVLEALSSGIPVLTNGIGIEGIPAEAGKDYFYCTKPEEYEMVIRNIYNGRVDVDKICRNAKLFMNTHFSMEQSLVNYKTKLIELKEK